MKVIKIFFLTFLFLFILPIGVSANEIIKEQNGRGCIDLEAVYKEINQSSKALTGDDYNIESVRRAQTVASLTNIISILIGDRIYCINDEVAASDASTLENIGLLGQLDEANSSMIAFFPAGGTMSHLAQEFLPGYQPQSSIFAVTFDPQGEIVRPLERQIGSTTDSQGGTIQDMVDEIEEDYEEGDIMVVSGYTYLKDYLQLDIVWRIFRNIAYVLFTIVMIVIGFMIMFRKELPGNVIVSIGNALPQVIIGIVLVTFSFAIVGFMMDAGKFSMSVITGIFAEAYSQSPVAGNIEEVITVDSVLPLANQAVQSAKHDGLLVRFIRQIPVVGRPIANTISGMSGTVVSIAGQSFFLWVSSEVVEKAANVDWSVDSDVPLADLVIDPVVKIAEFAMDIGVLAPLRGGIMALLVRNIILLLVCLYASFRVFITMLVTYLKLFVNVVLAPIQITLGSLPGNFSFTVNWFKSVLANVLVFVGIHLVINLFAYIARFVDPAKFNFFGNRGVIWPNWIVSLEGVILIAGYLFAANLPKVINGILKIESNKDMVAAGQAVQKAASKIPLVGGMFNT